MSKWILRNWPLKLAAVVLSLTLYVAVAAQEQQTQVFQMKVNVLVPAGRTLLRAPPQASVMVRGKGGELLKFRVFPRSIELRVPDTLTSALWQVSLQPADVPLPKGADVQVVDLSPRDLAIQLDSVGRKDVPIVARVNVHPDSGQALEGGLQITPSIARLVGPDARLATIDSVTTIPTDLDAVNGSFSRSVPLDTAPLGVVRIAPKEVRVSGTMVTIFERSFGGIPVESGAGPLTGFELRPPRVSVAVRGAETQVTGLTRDSLKVIVHGGLTADSAVVRLTVIAPRGVNARAVPDSVTIIRHRVVRPPAKRHG